MIILVAIAIIDIILLAATIWSARGKRTPRARFVIARGSNDLPHAL
jgi:hypothetical protein